VLGWTGVALAGVGSGTVLSRPTSRSAPLKPPGCQASRLAAPHLALGIGEAQVQMHVCGVATVVPLWQAVMISRSPWTARWEQLAATENSLGQVGHHTQEARSRGSLAPRQLLQRQAQVALPGREMEGAQERNLAGLGQARGKAVGEGASGLPASTGQARGCLQLEPAHAAARSTPPAAPASASRGWPRASQITGLSGGTGRSDPIRRAR